MNKFYLFFCACLLSGLAVFAAPFDTIPADNNLIEYTGRIDLSNKKAPKFSYSGVQIRACFTGTSIGMIMDDNVGRNYYNIILDGKVIDTINVTIGKKAYFLAEGLENKTHEIEIFKRTEQEFGKTQFFGFLVDKGNSLVQITNNRDILIEYIGNSITCGYGNEGANGSTFGPTTENHYLTFAAITSRNFNARHLAVCRSGVGVYRNYNGPISGNSDNMTDLYNRIFFSDATPKYSFSQIPDLVCIDLGTNDFSTTGANPELYKSNYFRLIDTIQTRYISKKPDIICLIGPMVSGSTLDDIKSYLKYIADSTSKKGKGKVYFFELSQQGSLGYGIDYHPTVAQHKKNANELTNYIKSIKGWKITPQLFSASLSETNLVKLEFNTTLDRQSNTGGFKVYKDGSECGIDSTVIDRTTKTSINIYIKEKVAINDTINVNYIPGDIKSEDGAFLGQINMFEVKNNLTETKINSGSVSSLANKMSIIFNKSIKKGATLEGFSFSNSKGALAVDSFEFYNSVLTVYLKNKIIKGDSVFASYSGNNITGVDGISLTNFTRFALNNNSNFTRIKVSDENYFSIYPNPNSTGIINYNLKEAGYLSVYSINGELIYNQQLDNLNGQLNLKGILSNGMYYFKLNVNNRILTRSVIIE